MYYYPLWDSLNQLNGKYSEFCIANTNAEMFSDAPHWCCSSSRDPNFVSSVAGMIFWIFLAIFYVLGYASPMYSLASFISQKQSYFLIPVTVPSNFLWF